MTKLSRRKAMLGGASLVAFAPFINACSPSSILRSNPFRRSSGEQPSGSDSAGVLGSRDVKDFVDGVRMAQLISSGEISASEVVADAIKRAKKVNRKLNAIVHDTFSEAKQEALMELKGTFAGVPSFTKDLNDRKGEPTQFGSRAFKGYVAEKDGDYVASWRRAGIISLGKSSTPEAGLTSTTEPVATGVTRNPWNLDRITGGSSGGSAALAAARVVPFAHANDGGGSIRIPASCCGLFGLKPSSGRMFQEVEPGPVDIAVDHAVTWTVRDSAALLQIGQKPDSDLKPVGAVTSPARRRLRIAVAPDPIAGTPVDKDVREGVIETAKLCENLGHYVFDYTPPIDGEAFLDAFLLYWAAGAADFANRASQYSGQPIGPSILENWTLGFLRMYQSEKDLERAVEYLLGFVNTYNAMFTDIDVLLTPTLARPADPIGYQDPQGDFEQIKERVVSFAAYTAPMNVSGAASMSVPLHTSSDGLPIGMLFSGKRGDEEMLLQLAYELEIAKPWINNVPKVVAG